MNPATSLIQIHWLHANVADLVEPPVRAIPSYTAGYVIEETDSEVVLAQTWHDGRYANLTAIPKGAIIGRKRLRTAEILP